MVNNKKIIATLDANKDNITTCVQLIDKALNHIVKPDFIYINLKDDVFTNGYVDVPQELMNIARKNPIVKVSFGDKIEFDNESVVVSLLGFNKYIQDIFNDKSSKGQYDVIISLTSFPDRFKNVKLIKKTLYSLVYQKTYYKFHIVLTLFKDDIPFLSDELLQYLYANDIEVLPCNEDLKGHKKYFYVMSKYPNLPIITVDDDMIYSSHMVQLLYDKYLEDNKLVYGGWVRRITYDNQGNLKPDIYWESPHDELPNIKNVGFSGSGLLIPPNVIKPSQYYSMIIDGNNIYHDEIILKKMFLDSNIDTCWVKNDIDGYKVWNKCSFILGKINQNSESNGALHIFNNTISENGLRNGDIVVRKYLSNIGVDLSIVIPVRNVTGFIDKFTCLMKSVEIQAFSRYEVILVNDHSDDETKDILNEYANNDSRIKVIDNTLEQGIGNSRNVGIDNATGEFIWIVDGDDCFYDKLVFSRLYRIINLNQQVDIIELKAKMSSGKLFNRTYSKDTFEKVSEFKQGQYLNWNLSRNPIIASWGRAYNRLFLQRNKSIRFSNTRFCNDLFFRLQGDALAKKVFISNGFDAYVYNVNTSTSISSITKKSNNFEEYWKIFDAIVGVKYPSDQDKIDVIGNMYQRMMGVLSTINRCVGSDEYHRCLNIFSNILNKYDLSQFVDMQCFNKDYPQIMKELKVAITNN